jgi:hypothetical protein
VAGLIVGWLFLCPVREFLNDVIATQAERSNLASIVSASLIPKRLTEFAGLIGRAIADYRKPSIGQQIVEKQVNAWKDFVRGDEHLFGKKISNVLAGLKDGTAEPAQDVAPWKLPRKPLLGGNCNSLDCLTCDGFEIIAGHMSSAG